jgi:hypothetical protein
MSDMVIAVSGDWSVATDGLQWILQKRRKGKHPWYGVSFVRSTRDILARCMKEKGCPPDDAARLLAACSVRFEPPQAPPPQPDAKIAVAEAASEALEGRRMTGNLITQATLLFASLLLATLAVPFLLGTP